MGSYSHILFKTIAWLLVMLIAAVLVLTFVGVKVDLSFLRGGVEVAAEKALGRDVTIEGPVELKFSNWPALDVSDIKIANAAGASQPDFLNAGFARMQIGIIPLLQGKINIAEISIDNVTLNLESDVQGRPNWVFDKLEVSPQEQPLAEYNSKLITFTGLDQLSLKRITVNYHDAALNKSVSFVLDSMVGTAAEGKPISLELKGHIQDKMYDLELDGGPLIHLLDEKEPWGFELKGEVVGKKITGKGDMMLREHEPEINLAFGVRNVDVGAILSALGLVEGMHASLGDADIRVSINGDSLKEVMQQSSIAFTTRGGSWKVTLPNSDISFDINDLHGDILVERGNAVTMKLDGVIDETPVKLLITGSPLVDYVSKQDEIPLTIDAEFANSRLIFASKLKLPITNRDMTLGLKVTSERIDHLNDLFRLDLPPFGPLSLESKLDLTRAGYNLSTLAMQVGDTRLEGNLKLNTSLEKPKLDISLVSELIQLDDFDTGEAKDASEKQPTGDADAKEIAPVQTSAETAEEQQTGGTRNLLSYEVLNAFDANIKIEAQKVRSGKDKLGSARMRVGLKDARLSVEPLRIDIPGGGIQINMDVTPSATDVTLNLKADIEEFDIGVMVRRAKPDADMGGKFTLDANLHSQAPDLTSVMEHANGHFNFLLVPKNFSAGIIDLWAVNLLSAIIDKSTEKDQSQINCVVVRFGIEDGLMDEKAIYLDTSNMRIAGKSQINFKTRELGIKLAPKAKKPEFFSMAVPIKVKGKFDDFDFKVGMMRMTGQVISFVTSPIHVPIQRLFTKEAPADGLEACEAAWTKTGKKDTPGEEKNLPTMGPS